MASNSTQAEKWRQWKQKMSQGIGGKHHENIYDDRNPKQPNTDRGFGSSFIDDTQSKHNISRDSRKTKQTDKTLQMMEEFVKRCQQRRETSDSTTSPQLDRGDRLGPTEISHRINLGAGLREDRQSLDQRRWSNESLEHHSQCKRLSQSGSERGYLNDSDLESNSSIAMARQMRGISPQSTISQSSDSYKMEPPAKKVCNKTAVVQRSEALANKNRPAQTSKISGNREEKCRRTVQLVKDNKITGAQDNDKNNKESNSLVDVLQKEGQRLMINYMAEYETSSNSSEDEEVVGTKPVPETVDDDVKFVAHLFSSMKTVKPYRSVIFDVIESNDGKAYSPTTGRFKAPHPGTYVFYLTVTSSITEHVDLNVMHNFHPVEPTKIKTTTLKDGDMETRTDALILTLEKRDEIWLLNVTRGPQARQLKNCHFLTFSGFFLKL